VCKNAKTEEVRTIFGCGTVRRTITAHRTIIFHRTRKIIEYNHVEFVDAVPNMNDLHNIIVLFFISSFILLPPHCRDAVKLKIVSKWERN
jgi:hypothetical protein